MSIDFNIMAGGEAGQGVQSIGAVLARTMTYGGLYVFADQDYENRVRGGHNFFRVRVSDQEVLAISEELEILIALNRETVDLHRTEVKKDGVIVFDSEQTKLDINDDTLFGVPITRLAIESAKNKLMTNTVAVGAAVGLAKYDFNLLETILKKEFSRLGNKIVEGNVAAARAGFDFALKYGKERLKQKLQPISAVRRMLLHGNEALALGALAGGCKFVAGYPMTPATPILEYIADKGKHYDVVAIHVEDEIAAINMAIGAAFTGVRAMVGTSGGGFCLMVEGLALAGITEIPVVMVLGQRPGPATGMPTRTEQGELDFALHAGHGEFPRAVLAPATAEGAFHAMLKAFNLAERYQTPVIILSDHHLATSYATVERFDLQKIRIDRGELLSDKEVDGLKDYKRHLLTESGVSPRVLPGQGKALVVTDSDEHDEAGHMIEDGETRTLQNLKRLRKINGLKAEIGSPEVQIKKNAEFTFIGWGSTYGAIREAANLLEKDGVEVSTIHLSEIWPFPVDELASVIDNKTKTVVIESNATAQMVRLIRRETGLKVSSNILRFDGRPITPKYIVEQMKREVR